ncbi:hypothetical protein [Methanoregula formicica]|uniref:hypothetical protein n=1 Tax=Methanoregula formicica TaxID=882104 RepID=UPI0011D1B609|nr:hypothetical protein [Methanoregula formicica]
MAPPKETPGSIDSAGSSSIVTGEKTIPGTTATPANVYVTEVTPYVTLFGIESPDSSDSRAISTPTPVPEDRSCRIFTTTQTYFYNGTAFTFDLKNPPMYINYSVIPQNITVNKPATSRFGKKEDVVYQYSTYDPQSYLIITVRSKSTGEIYLEDGFGTEYTTYPSRTLKVLNADDMLIEINGNKITATTNFWVKPYGNFDDPQNMTFDTCTYWGQTRDVTAHALVTATTTPTWAPGNVIKR